MKGSMKNLMIGLSSMMAASFLLTACNTVQGTVQGVGEDVHAVTRAAPPPPAKYRKAKDHCPGHHKKKKKKRHHRTTTTQQTTTNTNMKTTDNTVQDTPQEMAPQEMNQ